jgi:hypothetical protein
MNPLAGLLSLFRRSRSRSGGITVSFDSLSLGVTPEQLSYWEDHPNEVRVFRHTEETIRLVKGQPLPQLWVAMFAFRLPFDLPVPDGAAFGLRRSQDPNEPVWVNLMVHRVKIELSAATLAPYDRGLAVLLEGARADLRHGFSGQTWVLAQTLGVTFADEPVDLAFRPGGAITVGFERCLSALNIVCDASRLVSHDPYSRPLTKESLDPQITWFHVDVETGEIGDRHQMRLHHRVYNPRSVVDDPEEMHWRLAGC